MLKEEDILNSVVPVAHFELKESVKTAFATLWDAMKVMFSVQDEEFEKVNAWSEIKQDIVRLEREDLSLLNPGAMA